MLIDEVFGVDYRYQRLALDGRFPVTKATAVAVGLDYRIVTDVGVLLDRFSATALALLGSLHS